MNSSRQYLAILHNQIRLWQRSLKLVWLVIPYWTFCWTILLLLLGVLPGATIYLTKLTIDSFIAIQRSGEYSAQLNHSVMLLVLTGGTLLSNEILQSLIDWVRAVQADKLLDHLKNLIHRKAFEVDYEFYESPGYHNLLEQANSESLSKPLNLLENFGSVVQSIITLLTFSTILLRYGWWIPLILLIGTLPSLYIYFLSERLYHKWWKQTAVDRRWLMYFDTMISYPIGAAEMRIFNLNGYLRGRYQNLRLRLRGEKVYHLKRQFGGKIFASSLALLTAAIGVGWIALQVLRGLATIGDLAVFYQVFSRGQVLMRSLIGGMSQTFSNSLYLENLFEYLDLQSKITSPPTPISFPGKLRHGIKFNNITFKYPGAERAVIKDFSLFIPAGNLVAVVGINGAGKSTLTKLLCRFYDPESGSIEIDGINIKNFDIADLRKNLSLHFQMPIQYHETAAQNIAFGDIDRQPETGEVENAAKLAGAHEFISRLPKSYETMLGKWFVDGCELSGGEWQRIALARAYFRKSPILILDEPTSFMDSWAEAEWFDHLRELAADRTGLVITHRFTIAMRADIIHVVHDGKIIESGSHRELLQSDGFYAQSWKTQMQIGAEDLSEPSHIKLNAAQMF